MDLVLPEYQRLQFWWKCQENHFHLADAAPYLLEVAKFLGTVALIATTGLSLLLAA